MKRPLLLSIGCVFVTARPDSCPGSVMSTAYMGDMPNGNVYRRVVYMWPLVWARLLVLRMARHTVSSSVRAWIPNVSSPWGTNKMAHSILFCHVQQCGTSNPGNKVTLPSLEPCPEQQIPILPHKSDSHGLEDAKKAVAKKTR